MKKLICMLVMISLLAAVPPSVAAAAPGDEARLDVAIVIDKSGSMKQTDKNRLAIEAAKLFVDMMGVNGSRVGVVSFSNDAVRLVQVTDVTGISSKSQVKSAINSLAYDGDTDIGLALKAGIDLVDSAKDIGNRKMILFFTDGRIDTQGKNGRTDEQSREDTLNAIQSVSGRYPIYSIGLNADGSVDTELIQRMADSTDGRCYIVDNSDALPNIFNEIFADFIKSNIISLGSFVTDGVNYTEVPVDIPNSNILEANIIMLLEKDLMEVAVYGPDGNALPLDDKKVILSKSNMYYLLKLVSPQEGKWVVKIKGPKDCRVHVNLVYNYDLLLRCELKENPDGTRQVTGHFEKEEQPITEKSFYEGFKAVATVKSSDGTTGEYPMQAGDNGFSAGFKAEKPGDYTVTVRADSESVYRISNTVGFSVKANGNPSIGSDFPENIELKGLIRSSLSKKVSYAQSLSDPDGDQLSLEFSGLDDKIASVAGDEKNGEFVIKAKGNGETDLNVIVSDGRGGTAQKTVHILVKATFPNILPIVLMILALAALVVAAVFLLKKVKETTAYFYGCVKYMVSSAQNTEREQRYELGYDRGSIRLNKIINTPETSHMELDKIVLYPNTVTNSGIKVVNKSGCTMVEGFGGSVISAAALNDGKSVLISRKNEAGTITIKLTYSLRN